MNNKQKIPYFVSPIERTEANKIKKELIASKKYHRVTLGPAQIDKYNGLYYCRIFIEYKTLIQELEEIKTTGARA